MGLALPYIFKDERHLNRSLTPCSVYFYYLSHLIEKDPHYVSEKQEKVHPVKVWDLPTRVFHWSLVALVAIGLITGFLSPEWWMGVHLWAGYGTVLLVVFRLVWGIFGSEYSRLETFTFTPREVIAHIREVFFLRPTHYIGHNPAGALMIFALIFILAGITISGLLVLGGEENQGPLAGAANYQIGDMAADIHEALTFILMVLIAFHIVGVFTEIHLSGENLVRSMIDGIKRVPDAIKPPIHRDARPLAAITTMVSFAMLAGSLLWLFSTMPPSGLIAMAVNEDFQRECGDCHEVYHPSLLPRASWTTLMAGLDDHFGEDASLEPDTAIVITAHLATYGSESWDTEAANRFRTVSPDAPIQISATPYWLRKHDDIGEATFKRKGVGGKSHCKACHRDAESGRFDDQKIKIPNE